MSNKSIFELILDGEVNSNIIYENDYVFAINDINPVSKIHILIIPKKKIESINFIEEEDSQFLAQMFLTAKLLANKYEINNSGYRLVVNTGANSFSYSYAFNWWRKIKEYLTMKEITIPQNQDIVKLLGINDVNLKYLRKAFPSIELNVRGNSIFLEGDEKLISDFQKIFDEMVIMNKKNENIEISDIELLTKLNTKKNQKNESFNQLVVTNNKQIKIKNLTQFKYLEAIEKSTITFGIGPAGTGKTFLAVASAVKMYSEEKIKKIVLTRPAVEAGERLGYLPGDLSQKIDPYLVPLFDSLEYFLGNESLQYLIEKRNIEIVPLAYMRGRTLNNACIILDEAQNSTLSQIKMFLTRLGEGSKMIITGDEIEVVEFILTDIVRNKIVSKILEVFPKNNE